MTELTAEEFGGWKQHPTTKAVMAELSKYREDMKEQWAGGVEMDASVQHGAQAFGFVINLTFEELRELNDDDE